MWNRNKEYMDWLRAQMGFKCQGGMLTYEEKEHPELDEEKVLDAIHTISVASKLPESSIRNAISKLIDRMESQEFVNHLLDNLKVSVKNFCDAATKDAEAISNFANSNPYKNANVSIETDLCPEDTHTDIYDSLCGMYYGPTTGAEFFRQDIVDTQTYVIRGDYYTQERYESQHEVANRNRHTSRHIPFYFPVFGESRSVPKKSCGKIHTRINRNVRPKGTHSHFRFYR